MQEQTQNKIVEIINELGPAFSERVAEHDNNDTFVSENYAALKEKNFFAALIPVELGGGGATHAEMCDALRVLAQYCSFTALANSMHQHLVGANVWKYKRGQGAEDMLKKVAQNQPVLVSLAFE